MSELTWPEAEEVEAAALPAAVPLARMLHWSSAPPALLLPAVGRPAELLLAAAPAALLSAPDLQANNSFLQSALDHSCLQKKKRATNEACHRTDK